ncbi:MAG: hypothetical protein HYZ83_06920 [Candidatus Omnitrophica bacterium]|nr:hypothetical protein [Candidatus Omnitrophota bacterium]
MIMSLTKEKNKVIINSSEGVFERFFDQPIYELILFQNRALVLIDTLGKKNATTEKNRNVFCLNEKAELLWQIQDPDTFRPGLSKSESPFTGIYIDKEGRLRARNWDSHGYAIDVNTGELLEAHWTK